MQHIKTPENISIILKKYNIKVLIITFILTILRKLNIINNKINIKAISVLISSSKIIIFNK